MYTWVARELRRVGVCQWPQYAKELARAYAKDGLTPLGPDRARAGRPPGAVDVQAANRQLWNYLALPVLGAHQGWPVTMKELGRAVANAMRTGGNMARALRDPEEIRARLALPPAGLPMLHGAP